MTISFNEIPVSLRVPGVYTEYDSSNAIQGSGVQPYKGLIIGQRLSTGKTAALTPVRITSVAQAAELFGAGSVIHGQAKAWFAENTFTDVFAVAFDDPAGAKAAGSINITGTATVAGTLTMYISGRKVTVGINASDTGASIATKTVAAINAKTDIPVTAVVNGTVTTKVDITARNAGTLGNQIDIRLNYYEGEETPAGLTTAIIAMTGGTGVPDFSTLWAVLGDTQYNIWAMPYTDTASLAAVNTELESRYSALRQIEAMAFAAKDDTVSNLSTFGSAQNGRFMCTAGFYKSPTPAYEIGASLAAAVSYYGQIDQARPFQTLALSHVMAPKDVNRFTMQERNILLYDGISTSYVDNGGVVRIERLVSMYEKNSHGADDESYLSVNTLLTLSYIRWSVRNRLLLKYPRHKLADDGTRFGQGQAIVTPKVIKAELVNLFAQWEEKGLVEGREQFKKDVIVERNADDRNRLDVVLPPDIVNQLCVTAIKIQFIV